MAVPTKLQAVLFKKIFHYDKALKSDEPGELKVLVMHTEAGPLVSEIVQSFAAVGIGAIAVTPATLSQQLLPGSVIYVAPGTAPDVAKKLSAENSLLSITGVPSMVEAGEVSVGVGVKEDGRSEIVVHLGRLKIEGHELSSTLLGLARVIK